MKCGIFRQEFRKSGAALSPSSVGVRIFSHRSFVWNIPLQKHFFWFRPQMSFSIDLEPVLSSEFSKKPRSFFGINRQRQKSLNFAGLHIPVGKLTAEELQRKGLVHSLAENPLEEAKSMALKINEMAPLSLEHIKNNINLAQDASFNKSIENETNIQGFLGNSQDYQEGLKAFFEKRKTEGFISCFDTGNR